MAWQITSFLSVTLQDWGCYLASWIRYMFNYLCACILNLGLWIFLVRITAWRLHINNLSIDILCLNRVTFASSGAILLLDLQRSVILLLLLHPLYGCNQLLVVYLLHRAIWYCSYSIFVCWLLDSNHGRFRNFCWCCSFTICFGTWLSRWVTRITTRWRLINCSFVQERVIDVWIDFSIDVHHFKSLLNLDASNHVAVFATCGARAKSWGTMAGCISTAWIFVFCGKIIDADLFDLRARTVMRLFFLIRTRVCITAPV